MKWLLHVQYVILSCDELCGLVSVYDRPINAGVQVLIVYST